ncbi:MAG TPA: energy transducer TonB [Gemmatimonadales bacterium]|nr:energy transducer TonB [Gemmatimonadales bacterium]
MLRTVALVVAGLAVSAGALGAQATPDAPMVEGAVEQRPIPVPGSCQAPVYPATLRAARMEGRVILQFVVDTLGRIEANSVRALSSSHTYFEEAARRALLTCRYQPALFNGRPVRVLVQLPFNFQLARR